MTGGMPCTRGGVDIIPASCALTMLASIGEGDDGSVTVSDQPRMLRQRGADTFCHHRSRWSICSERHGRITDIWAVDPDNGCPILNLGRSDLERSCFMSKRSLLPTNP